MLVGEILSIGNRGTRLNVFEFLETHFVETLLFALSATYARTVMASDDGDRDIFRRMQFKCTRFRPVPGEKGTAKLRFV